MATRITRAQRLERGVVRTRRSRRVYVLAALLLIPVFGVLCLCAYVAATAAFLAAGTVYLMETAPGGQLAAVKEGSAAPDFSLQTLEGTEASLRQFRGGPVLVTFWASWCAPCMVELQALGRLEDMPDGPVVIAVNMGEDRETAQSALARAGADLLCLLDSDQRTARRYGAWSLPTSVMVDADGIVRSARVGAMGLEELEAFVETAMPAGGARNGRPSRSPRPQSEDEAYPASSDGQHDAGRHVSESG